MCKQVEVGKNSIVGLCDEWTQKLVDKGVLVSFGAGVHVFTSKGVSLVLDFLSKLEVENENS